MALVIRDFIHTLYALYPDIRAKNNEEKHGRRHAVPRPDLHLRSF